MEMGSTGDDELVVVETFCLGGVIPFDGGVFDPFIVALPATVSNEQRLHVKPS